MNEEWWRMMIFSCWGVLVYKRQTNGWTFVNVESLLWLKTNGQYHIWIVPTSWKAPETKSAPIFYKVGLKSLIQFRYCYPTLPLYIEKKKIKEGFRGSFYNFTTFFFIWKLPLAFRILRIFDFVWFKVCLCLGVRS